MRGDFLELPRNAGFPPQRRARRTSRGSGGSQGGVPYHVCENSPSNQGDPAPTLCSDDQSYSADVHSCVCDDAALALSGGNCVADCPNDGLNERGLCVAECGAGRVEVDSFCLSPDEATGRLRTEVQKSAPDAGEVRKFISAGANVEASISAVPLLATTAALGHAEVVSILITAGADPTARRGNDLVPHIVALQSSGRPTVMLNVLRAFVGGLSVAGKLQGFDWSVRSVSDSALDLLDNVSAGPGGRAAGEG